MGSSDDRLWQIAGSGALRSEPLDSLTAIFDRRSGQTHLLAAPLPEILEALAEGACTSATLVARLAERFDLSGGDDRALLDERLAELVERGLIA